jgi:hypothetical protein
MNELKKEFVKNTLELTPEWVLEKLPHTHYADGSGKISVYIGDATDANYIELALDSLQINYEAYDYLDDNDDFVYGFDFRIEDIQVECPSFYQSMKELDENNLIHKNLSKN